LENAVRESRWGLAEHAGSIVRIHGFQDFSESLVPHSIEQLLLLLDTQLFKNLEGSIAVQQPPDQGGLDRIQSREFFGNVVRSALFQPGGDASHIATGERVTQILVLWFVH
jgi:hypothetical protein